MADLFTRLAVRNADRATALRPLPAAARAARPAAGDRDAEVPTPSADTARLGNDTEHRRGITGPPPVPLRGADGDDANQAAGAPLESGPDGEDGPDQAATGQAQFPAPDEDREADATSTPTTLTEVIAALDAGAVVDTPHAASAAIHPTTAVTPAPAIRSPRRSERDDARAPAVVTVTIGELVVRGTVGEPAGRQSEPAPLPAPHTAARDLSLHDYLRGSRGP